MPKRSSVSQMLSVNNDEPAAVLNIIEPTINNIDYLSEEAEYVITQEVGIKVQSMVMQLEFTPNQWVSWLQNINQQLEFLYQLNNLIEEDVKQRELQPVQFTMESDFNFNKRLKIYKRRVKAVFLALSNHEINNYY